MSRPHPLVYMRQYAAAVATLSLVVSGLTPISARGASPGLTITEQGLPAKWDNTQPIFYDLDLGPLSNPSNVGRNEVDPRAERLVATAFEQWAMVGTARLSFKEGIPLDRDVTGANLLDFFHKDLSNDVNPVIFDSDGTVIDTLLGKGASRQLLAFGRILQAAPNGQIEQGMVVLNGRMLDGRFGPAAVTPGEMARAAVRAIGQMLNLGDSDLNDEAIFDGQVVDLAAVPVMHPGAIIHGTLIPILSGGALTLDDQMSVSALYPADNFGTSTGTIQGQVLLPDGTTGLQGIDVIARKVDDRLNSAVSAISGETFKIPRGDGSTDPSQRGAFTIHVPPGNYTLEFRPLRQPIGPLGAFFPLPGGTQFYQASPAPSPTAGPAIPASATPVTVNAGQTTTVKFVSAGKPAPAPQAVIAPAAALNSTETAPALPLSATVTGHVAPSPPGTQSQVVLDVGGGLRDVIEDLYRLDVPEQSILTLELTPKDKVDLDLYVFAGFIGGAAPSIVAASATAGTDPEALQAVLTPGTYFIGVSAWDNVMHPAATDYTLSLITTPLPVQPTPQRPVLNQFVLGNITDKTADVNWITDTGASTVAVVGMPLQQFGDPTLGQTHHLTLMGLTPGAFADITALSQTAAGNPGYFPKMYFRTADTMAATSEGPVQAVVNGTMQDFIYNGQMDLSTMLVEVAIQNQGGPVRDVQITSVTPTPGWKAAVPPAQPLMVGGIGSNGIALVGVRLLRDGTGPSPLASVTGTGTYTAADRTVQNFTFGP